MPYGLIFSIVYVIFHSVIWAVIDINFIYSAPEMSNYIRDSFNKTFQEDIRNVNFVCGLFSETTPDIVRRSWAGIILLTLVASYSMILYVVLGYKVITDKKQTPMTLSVQIITGINSGLGTMSQKTSQMQKQLFKALTIQTVIPICVSFMPCSLSFYGAALRIDFFG